MKFSQLFLTGISLAASVLARPAHPTKEGSSSSSKGGSGSSSRGVSASLQDAATVGYATMNGGTTGGKGGAVINVSTFEELEKAAISTTPAIIVVSGKIVHEGRIKIGSNKSIVGKNSGAELVGTGFFVRGQKNIIVRNLKINHVKAANGDAIGMQSSTNIWIDHVDVSSDKEHGKDFYDGLIDLTHATDFVTVSNSHIHDHYKASLVGHSDKNAAEDTGKLHVTYANNYWTNINSRAPSLRFGTAHVFDSLFVNVVDGINVRKGAQALVQNDAFEGSTKPLYTVDSTGGAVETGNDFGVSKALISEGSLKTVPYKYTLASVEEIKVNLPRTAGNTLSF